LNDVVEIYNQIFAKVEPKAKGIIDAYAAATSESSKLSGVDEAMAALVGQPIRLELASNLTTERIREIDNSLPNQLRNGRAYKFGATRNLKPTHEGAPTHAMVVEDKPNPVNSPVFIRGEANSRGEMVPRRFLEILSGPKSKPFTDGSGRFEL